MSDKILIEEPITFESGVKRLYQNWECWAWAKYNLLTESSSARASWCWWIYFVLLQGVGGQWMLQQVKCGKQEQEVFQLLSRERWSLYETHHRGYLHGTMNSGSFLPWFLGSTTSKQGLIAKPRMMEEKCCFLALLGGFLGAEAIQSSAPTSGCSAHPAFSTGITILLVRTSIFCGNVKILFYILNDISSNFFLTLKSLAEFFNASDITKLMTYLKYIHTYIYTP